MRVLFVILLLLPCCFSHSQDISYEYINYNLPEAIFTDCAEDNGKFYFLATSYYLVDDTSTFDSYSSVFEFQGYNDQPSKETILLESNSHRIFANPLVVDDSLFYVGFQMQDYSNFITTALFEIFNADFESQHSCHNDDEELKFNLFISGRKDNYTFITNYFLDAQYDFKIQRKIEEIDSCMSGIIDFDTTNGILTLNINYDTIRNRFYLSEYNFGVIEVDSNFNLVEEHRLWQYGVGGHGDLIPFRDHFFIMGAYREVFSGLPYREIVIGIFDTIFSPIKLDTFGVLGQDDYPFLYNSVDYRDDYYFIGWHRPMPFPEPHHSTQPLKFTLVKLDSMLNIVWYKEYGGDHNYLMMGLHATDDGGCLAYGKVRPDDLYAYPYIIKVDAYGNLLTNTSEPEEAEEFDLKVLKNPGPGPLSVQIRLPNNHSAHLHLVDLQGRNVFTSQVQAGFQTFDTSGLPSGLYVVTLVGEHGSVLDQEKWVKSR